MNRLEQALRGLHSFLLAALLALQVGCASTSEVEVAHSSESPHADYFGLVQKFTRQAYLYSGFINVFQLHATMINEEILARQLRYLSQSYGWSDDGYRKEREKAVQRASSSIDFFLSFFAADLMANGLDGEKSVWRFYLESAGQRYQGTVKKWKAPGPEIEAVFPFVTRWHTAYRVTFPVGTGQVQNQETKFVIQGPLGHQELAFPAVIYTGAQGASLGVDNGVGI